ncbi:MAG: ferrous iron transport protein A [Saprospiraceae bacterium]
METELPKPQGPCAAVEINALELDRREKGVVCGFADDCFARKYLSMGILPGSRVELVRKAPVGQTCYFKIDGRSLAVRKKEAACLLLHRVD